MPVCVTAGLPLPFPALSRVARASRRDSSRCTSHGFIVSISPEHTTDMTFDPVADIFAGAHQNQISREFRMIADWKLSELKLSGRKVTYRNVGSAPFVLGRASSVIAFGRALSHVKGTTENQHGDSKEGEPHEFEHPLVTTPAVVRAREEEQRREITRGRTLFDHPVQKRHISRPLLSDL
jgi:hypothetical protein